MENNIINGFNILLNNCNKNHCKLVFKELIQLDMWNNKIVKINRNTKKSLTYFLSTKEDTIIATKVTYSDIFLYASKNMILNTRKGKEYDIKQKRLSPKDLTNQNYTMDFELKDQLDMK